MEALQRTEKTWANFPSFQVADGDARTNAINKLLQNHPELSEKQSGATLALLHDLLLGYGGPDWQAFMRFRIPASQYQVTDSVLRRLVAATPELTSPRADPLERYESIWRKTFTSPLWKTVAFFDASLTISNLPPAHGFELPIPKFTFATNQNWMGQTWSPTFDYSGRLKTPAHVKSTATFLQLCFLGRTEIGSSGDCNLFAVLLFWDDLDGRWLPASFAQHFTRTPPHQIEFF
ncbi:MAG: hypothetical protein NTX27_08495 [Verrucomicrobia bacterium]|nr:hypothetical protein [Verrucomicrobiota bacterium]